MSAPRVVVVNGPPGVGKTTVARLLAGAVPNGVCVHGDRVRDFVVTREPDRPHGLTYVAAAALAGVYLGNGFDRVVVEYVFEQPCFVRRFTDALADPADCRVVTLWAPLSTVRDRERGRVGRERLGDRVDACWSAMAEHLGGLGTTVDASGTPDTVAAAVEQAITAKATTTLPGARRAGSARGSCDRVRP